MPYGIKKEVTTEEKPQEAIPEELITHCLNHEGDDLFMLRATYKGKKVSDETFNSYAESFKQRALTAKAEADAGKIPSDVAFVGKFEVKEVVKP